jgi:hypothetical protein
MVDECPDASAVSVCFRKTFEARKHSAFSKDAGSWRLCFLLFGGRVLALA